MFFVFGLILKRANLGLLSLTALPLVRIFLFPYPILPIFIPCNPSPSYASQKVPDPFHLSVCPFA